MDDERARVLGEYIATERRRQGLSLRALADASGVSPSSLHDIENGRYLPKADTQQGIARALGVEWEDLQVLLGYTSADALPSFVPYLRSKYGEELSRKQLRELERFFRDLTKDDQTEGK